MCQVVFQTKVGGLISVCTWVPMRLVIETLFQFTIHLPLLVQEVSQR